MGSNQHQASHENFDSGVDDLQNPKHYIIWDLNMYTHIYAEFIVTINLPTNAKGNFCRSIWLIFFFLIPLYECKLYFKACTLFVTAECLASDGGISYVSALTNSNSPCSLYQVCFTNYNYF